MRSFWKAFVALALMLPLGAFVANRVHQPPGSDDPIAIARRLRAHPALGALGDDAIAAAADKLAAAARDVGKLCASERRELARLTAQAPGVPTTEVPLFDHEVETLLELRRVAEHLT